MILSLCLVLIAILLTGISQVLLKMGSKEGDEGSHFSRIYLNVKTLAGYGLLLFVTFISVLALREIPLKVFYALASLNFIVVPLLSAIFLGESVNKKQSLAILLIAAGIVVFNLRI